MLTTSICAIVHCVRRSLGAQRLMCVGCGLPRQVHLHVISIFDINLTAIVSSQRTHEWRSPPIGYVQMDVADKTTSRRKWKTHQHKWHPYQFHRLISSGMSHAHGNTSKLTSPQGRSTLCRSRRRFVQLYRWHGTIFSSLPQLIVRLRSRCRFYLKSNFCLSNIGTARNSQSFEMHRANGSSHSILPEKCTRKPRAISSYFKCKKKRKRKRRKMPDKRNGDVRRFTSCVTCFSCIWWARTNEHMCTLSSAQAIHLWRCKENDCIEFEWDLFGCLSALHQMLKTKRSRQHEKHTKSIEKPFRHRKIHSLTHWLTLCSFSPSCTLQSWISFSVWCSISLWIRCIFSIRKWKVLTKWE